MSHLIEMDEVRNIVESVFSSMPLHLEASVSRNEEEVHINITGKDRAYLITDNGETLLSFQYLFSRMIRRKYGNDDPVRILVDSDGYLFRRDEHLRALAENAVRQVRREKRRVKLRYMNPYERRIIHMEIAGNDDMDSLSEGEGFFKQIVVRLKRYPTGQKLSE